MSVDFNTGNKPLILISNFQIISSAINGELNLSYTTSDGGVNEGGYILFTPTFSGGVQTGFWDTDGNLLFTITTADGKYVTINSGCDITSSSPVKPSVSIWKESNLKAEINFLGNSNNQPFYQYEIVVKE